MNALLLYFLIGSGTAQMAEAPSSFKALQTDGNITIESPFGSHLLLGEVGFGQLKSYKIEIPISDLKPPPSGGRNATGGSSGESGKGESSRSGSVDDDDILIVQANEAYNRGNFSESLQSVDELLRRQPTLTRAWIMKGSLMHAMGHTDLARKAWMKAQELDPKNKEIHDILGRYP